MNTTRWIYVRCLVRQVDPEAVAFIDSLAEKIDHQPRLDVVPSVHSSSISFEHVFVTAGSEADAYERGGNVMGEPPEDVICMNDYVVELSDTGNKP